MPDEMKELRELVLSIRRDPSFITSDNMDSLRPAFEMCGYCIGESVKSNVTNKPTKTPMPKEPELMTLQEALPKITDGVRFKKTDKNAPADDSTIINKNGLYFWESTLCPVKMSDKNFKMIGRIIPAEPKILSAEEYLESVSLDDLENNYDEAAAIYNAGAYSQWLNHKELREAVEKHIDNADIDFTGMEKSLKNLKPLKSK